MTDKLPPHIKAMQRVRASIKPPRPEMETIQRGSASLRPHDPDPLRPVVSDTATRWVPLSQAVEIINAVIPDRKAAENAIMKAALDGALVLSCELLIAKPMAGGEPLFSVTRPGKDAKLGQRIDKAFKSDPLSNFNYDAPSDRVSWVNLISGVRVIAQRLLVDAEGVAAFYAVPVLSALNTKPVEAAGLIKATAPDGWATLPPTAKDAHRRDEGFAHLAADLVRAGQKLSAAIRSIAPTDGTRDAASIERGIRAAFDLMYDRRGNPV